MEQKLRRVFQRRKIRLLALTLAFLLVGVVFGLLVGSIVVSLLSLFAAVLNLLAGAVQILQVFNDDSNKVVEEEMRRSTDLDYRRLIGILDRVGVSFAEMVEKYAGGKEVVLVSVDEDRNLNSEEGTLVAGPSGHEDPETVYLHSNEQGTPEYEGTRGSETTDHVFVSGLDTYQVFEGLWLIPPRAVPDSVAQGETSPLDEFVEDSDDVAFAAVVDFLRVFPRDDNRLRTLLEDAGVIDEEAVKQAIWDNRVDLLKHVREANLAFFLPKSSLPDETERRILRNQDVVLRDVEPRTVRGLSDERNFEALVEGLERVNVTVGRRENIAREIVNRAEMWLERLDDL